MSNQLSRKALVAIFALMVLPTWAMAQPDGQQNGDAKKGFRRNRPAPNPAGMLRLLDKNKDGKISLDEAPERMKPRFDGVDQNSDGFIDEVELKEMFSRMGNRDRAGRPGNARRRDGKPGAGRPDGDRPAGPGGRGPGQFDIAALFKQMDKNKDGNLDQEEQAAVIAKFEEMRSRMRQMMGQRGPNGPGKKRPGGDRYGRPNTDPVKPKRPGK